MQHGESGGDATPRVPDGPPPAREQLPLPRRKRQAHIEPQLRNPGSPGTGTPFAAFAPPSSDTGPDNSDPLGGADRHDRAAAEFYAGTRRGRGKRRRTSPPRGGSVFWPDSDPPPKDS